MEPLNFSTILAATMLALGIPQVLVTKEMIEQAKQRLLDVETTQKGDIVLRLIRKK